MKNKLFWHVALTAAETAFLGVLVCCWLGNFLPLQRWGCFKTPEKVTFSFRPNQGDVLSTISQCRIYYATWSDPVLSERQVVNDALRVMSEGEPHSMSLPPEVIRWRLDFNPKDKECPVETAPKIEKVYYGDIKIADAQLIPFYIANYRVSGYNYTYKPFMNGWWRVLIPVGVVIWLAVVVGAWVYFRWQEI